MKAVILQPSYIPWRGYFDQIRRADLFIFYDDVQYDKHGWRNRNQIKTAQGKLWLTIPVHTRGVTAGVPIHQIRIDWSKPWTKNHLKSITYAYAKAPYFQDYVPLLENAYSRKDEFLANFTIWFTIELARELGIQHTRFKRSSEIEGASGWKTERLIQILQRVGAMEYLSGPAAKEYLDLGQFEKAGIAVEFMEYDYPEYPQLYPPYEAQVTILDLLFMAGRKAMQYI